MADYKIIASDLDGTLLNSQGVITEENFDAIRELDRRGVLFVPATGRSFVEIPNIIKELPYIRYFIHSSGAVVYDKLTEERISFCFPKENSSAIFKLLFNTDCHITVRHMGKMYTSRELMNDEAFERYMVWGAHADLLRGVGEAIDGFKDKFAAADNVEMISVFLKDDAELAALKTSLSQMPDINVASACPHNIELTYSKAGKGNGLLALAEKLGFSADQTIAVGDSENDITMITAAGLGLAMDNATDELKSCADEIICSNDEHAVDYMLKKYFR